MRASHPYGSLGRLISVATCFDRSDIPNLSELTSEALSGRRTALTEELATLSAIADADLTDAQIDRLEQIPAQLNALRAEGGRRAGAAAMARANAVTFTTEPEAEPEGDEAGDDAGDGDAAGDEGDGNDESGDDAGADSGQQAASNGLQAAGVRDAQVVATRSPVSRLTGEPQAAASARRVTGASDAGAQATETLPLYAAADVPGFSSGQQIGVRSVAEAVVKRASSFPKRSNVRVGDQFSNSYGIARLEKQFDPRAIANEMDAEAAIEFAINEANLPGGSLVASATGWCAPSQVLYTLSELETVSGIISLPEILAARGGFISTIGPTFAAIYAATGFSFTEAQDIAGNYSLTSEVNQLQEGGSGLTSWTITINGQTTASIDDDDSAAAVQAALEALSNVAPGDVLVTGTSNPISMTLTWGGALKGTNVAVSTTPTGGSGTVVVTTLVPGGAAGGPKPCYHVECPPFTEDRLDVYGVCISAGYLQNRAYPELTARIVRGALVAHEHRIAAALIAEIASSSTAVTFTTTQTSPGAAAPLLDAIDIQAMHMRYVNRMDERATLEVKLPLWAKGAIRGDLARRLGVDLISVPESRMMAWFAERNVAVQFIYNYQDFTGSPASRISWPTTVSFLMYPAGTWVKTTSGVIDLGVVHDSSMFKYNNYTALFTEEGVGLIKRNASSVAVAVPICASGSTAAGVELVCPAADIS